MHRHIIDPPSALLGLAAIGAGVLVAADRADSIVDNPVWIGAVAAVLCGVSLVPWHRLTRGGAASPPPMDDPAVEREIVHAPLV